MNSTQNIPIQSADHIQAWSRFIHSRLAFHTKQQENKDVEIPDMQLNIYAIPATTNILDCITIHKLQQATSQNEDLQHLKEPIIQGWPENRDQIPQGMRI